MRRQLRMVVAVLGLLLGAGAGTALADPPPSQTVGQSAGNAQQAVAASDATQVAPSNTSISIRVLSPGSDGAVSQSNTASSSATAGNTNSTAEAAGQHATTCGCLPGMQSIGQSALSGQAAGAVSGAEQLAPSNAASVSGPGPATQTNDTSSDASAGNANGTGQLAGQSGSGSQAIGQAAGNEQAAIADSSAKQVKPSNTDVSVRVLSPGDNGSVSQSNSADSSATAANANRTGQLADQAGSGSCKCGGSGDQTIGQAAGNEQVAGASSEAKQIAPKNDAISVRVLSPGDNGDVSQSNTVSSTAASGNTNATHQAAGQLGSGGSQTIGQIAGSEQASLADSSATQVKPSNTAASVRVLSPGKDGSTTQSNDASSTATAANLNGTTQLAGQLGKGSCECDGSGSQTIGQAAGSEQFAASGSEAKQIAPKNDAISVRVLSHGGGGHLSQSNTVSSTAASGNTNATHQAVGQFGSGGSQTIGQFAGNGQAAFSGSAALQAGASNLDAPVRVLSPGHDGSTTQSNDTSSTATAANLNGTTQVAGQEGFGYGRGKDGYGRGKDGYGRGKDGCGCDGGYQVIGQQALDHQGAAAGSLAVQAGATNTADPVRVHSPGGGGYVHQSNDVSSTAAAGSTNGTWQSALQGSRSKCGCDGGYQVIGQDARSGQEAVALSAAAQLPGREQCGCSSGFGNSADPVRVGSPGYDGRVVQSNDVSSAATAANLNGTTQSAAQASSGSGIQALGQQALSWQGARAFSGAMQIGASNDASPVRVHSPGGGGSVRQSNDASSTADSGNMNWTGQHSLQFMGGGCGCHGLAIQALGQSAGNEQAAAAYSAALQAGPSNRASPTLVLSPFYGGGAYQSNDADSYANGSNWNAALQQAVQMAA